MELCVLYSLIGLPSQMLARLDAVRGQVDFPQFEGDLALMMDGRTAASAYAHLQAALGDDPDKMLYCQLECARRAYDRYQAMSIAPDIYIATMRCFSRFLQECERKNGRMFFDRAWWTYRQISMSLFRLGALEYEFAEDEGENAIAVHIPSDANLRAEAVDASLAQAESFFQTYYPHFSYSKYTCESWLLSPSLKPLLPDGSNILAFQNRFQILREDREDQEYLEWLFQVPPNTDCAALPEHTGLQRKVKALLLGGGTVGSAYGIMPRGRY